MHTQYPPTVRRGTPLSLPLQRRLEDQKKPGAEVGTRQEGVLRPQNRLPPLLRRCPSPRPLLRAYL